MIRTKKSCRTGTNVYNRDGRNMLSDNNVRKKYTSEENRDSCCVTFSSIAHIVLWWSSPRWQTEHGRTARITVLCGCL